MVTRSKTEMHLHNFRKTLLMLLDTFCVTAAYLATWLFISGRASLESYKSLLFSSCILFVLCFEVVYILMGLYDSLWRYAEIYEFFRCMLASCLSVAAFILVSAIIYKERRIPYSVYLMSALFAVSLTLYSRLTYRMIRDRKLESKGVNMTRVLMVGAGESGFTLIREISSNPNTDLEIVAAVDDNPSKVGRAIQGVRVMGTIDDIPVLVDQCDIDTIIIAIPRLTEGEKRRVLDVCSKTQCSLRILPDIATLVSSGGDLLSAVRDVKVEDLLGRDQVELDTSNYTCVKGKRVMVTGGGGSIGSELCMQIASSGPEELTLIDIYENNAYDVQQAIWQKYGMDFPLDVRIASVRDSEKMDMIFDEKRPQVVFHAAAHKHVPLMETSPEEAVKNNVFGTYNTAKCADKYGVETFVLISTDKAVNPTSIMGATKRLCEMVIQYMSAHSKTRFAAVRFGNVLGSNGSVIPLFKQQIANGGPVTVTHPDVVRFFMTIPEAVSLIIKAAEMAKGGEIFILDMGQPVKITDLAENLIRLAGLVPYRDIKIEFIGLRPGEKLYEELLLSEEGVTDTSHDKIFIGNLKPIDEHFMDELEELRQIADRNDSKATAEKIISMVPTFIKTRS